MVDMTTLGRELKVLEVMNNFKLWLTLTTMSLELRDFDAINH